MFDESKDKKTAMSAMQSLIKAGADKAVCILSRGKKQEMNLDNNEITCPLV